MTVPPSVPPIFADPDCSTRFLRGRSLGGPGIDAAIRLAKACPEIRVSVFESSWSAVDLDRSLIKAHGFESRITAHHHDAWVWVMSDDRRAA